ncbi:hypothetical protein C8R44DRAFT_358683 [Mycena epipterygia]|nr:hypothetical protein C8R44DRAFT_358683 [Mycena epipterygia]
MVFISKLLVVFMASEFVRAQTLYHVGSEIGQITTEALSQSVSVSAAGVGADGATTYVEDILESYIAIEYSDTTVTLLTTPIAYTVTFVADASGYHESFQFGMEGQAFETCGFGADGHGTCVEELLSYFIGQIFNVGCGIS